jgi:transcriptional regulator with XRE-family HTH domain
MADETFGDRLKRLREQAGLTQGQLALGAGLSKSSIAKLEQDLREPTWATVRMLAQALGTSCAAFEDTAGPPAEKPPARLGRPRKYQPEEPAGQAEQAPRKPGRKKT